MKLPSIISCFSIHVPLPSDQLSAEVGMSHASDGWERNVMETR